MAISAFFIRLSVSSPSIGKTDIPALEVTRNSWFEAVKVLLNTFIIFSVILTISSTWDILLSIIKNSSPPNLAIVSIPLMDSCSALAIWEIIISPALWPTVSFIPLKPSISKNITPIYSQVLLDRRMAWFNLSLNNILFGKPVK